jgi:hypothetical protein
MPGMGLGLGMGLNIMRGMGGGGGAFSPASLAGLVVWLAKAGPYWQDTGRTTPADAAAEAVRVWDDTAGAATNAVAPADTNRPPLAAGVGGVLVPQFDGANDQLTVTLSVSQPFWAFSAVDILTETGTRQVMDSTLRALYGVAGGAYRMYAGSTILSGGVAATGVQVLAARFDGASSRLYKDGGAAIVSGNPGANGTGAEIHVGNVGSFGEPLHGRLHEKLVVTGALTDAEVNAVGEYLAAIVGTTWTPIA